ncbi:MAG: hypothetical protein EHM20_15290 [Alphaproteobacteria bacterium]|nr:MAG: hypothetical protein EHM20_15290 [Alphaproteobacteria bacterium]
MLNSKQYSESTKSPDLHEAVIIHDINSSISALQCAMEVVKDEWKSNPELVARILPLALDKINQLHSQLHHYRHYSP